jgi:hypothetical protein
MYLNVKVQRPRFRGLGFLDRLITLPVLSYCTILRLKPRNRYLLWRRFANTVAKATNRLHPRVCSRKRTVGVARGFSSFLGKLSSNPPTNSPQSYDPLV